MSKPNDFLATILYQPDATLEEMYANGITPDNTGIKERDEYRNIKAVQEAFKDKEGNFDEKTFNAFYDSALRVFNEYQNNDFSEKAVQAIETSPLDWTNLNGKSFDTSAKVHLVNLPQKYTAGLGNIWELGTPTFSDSEIAQTQKVLDENGNELDYTPNDARGGFFKGLLRDPMAIAIWEEDGTHIENGIEVSHKKGDVRRDENGNARYQLLGNKNAAGRQLLNYWDTVTIEGKWANKFDFMDSDGLRKSRAGVVAKTAFQTIPYFLPYVGPVYSGLMAAKELATAMPMFLNSINSLFTNDDENEFGQAMNKWSNRMNSLKPGMSEYGSGHFFSFENIGNIIGTSIAQLKQQRAIGSLTKLLNANSSVGRQASLAYMALTSGQDSYNAFKEAGATDQVAGIGALASVAALYGLMNINYFEDWLFKGTWLDEGRALKETTNNLAKDLAKTLGFNIDKPLTKFQATKLYQNIYTPLKNGIQNTLGPNISTRGVVDIAGRSFSEGLEEVAEEISTDAVKGLFLALESFGLDMTKARGGLDFNFSPEDFATRYGGAFIGGAIGGAVFEGVDYAEHKFSGTKRIVDLDTQSRLLWYLRNGHGREIKAEIKRMYDKGQLGNKNLSILKKSSTESPISGTTQVYQEGSESDNQNLFVYNELMNMINSLEHFLNSNKFLMSDEELIKKVLNLRTDKDAAKEAAKNLEDPLISKILELGLFDSVKNDANYLITKLNDLNTQINAKRKEVEASTPDGENKTEKVNNNQELKSLQQEYDELKEVTDEILAGKHADYYIEYGLFLADKQFNKYFKGGDSVIDSNVANYYFLKTGENFNTLSDEEKEQIRAEYTAFSSVTDYDDQRQRFEIFRNVNDRYSEILTTSQENLKNAKYSEEFSPEIYGNLEDKLNKFNSRLREVEGFLETELSDIDRERYEKEKVQLINNINVYTRLQKNDSLKQQRVKSSSIFNGYQNYAKNISEINSALELIQEQITALGETPDIEMLNELVAKQTDLNTQLLESQAGLIRERDLAMQAISEYYITLLENNIVYSDTGFLQNAIEFVVGTSDIRTRLSQSINDVMANHEYMFMHTPDLYETFLTNLREDPLNYEKHLESLAQSIYTRSRSGNPDITLEEAKSYAIETLGGLWTEIDYIIKAAKTYKEKGPKTPLLDILKNFYVEVEGRPLQILDMLEMESLRYSTLDLDEYVLSNPSLLTEIENALQVLNVITASIDAATNGYNLEANKYRTGEDKIKLAELSPNVAQIYRNEIATLRQRLTYLKELSKKNEAGQGRKQVDIMLNVEPKLIKSILARKDGIQEKLGVDVDDLWRQAGSPSLDNVTLETHPEVKKAKIEFEKLFFKEIGDKFRGDSKSLGNAIFEIFKNDDTLWTCNAGEFTKKMESFSPYVEMLYLTTIAGSDSHLFSSKWNEKVLQNEQYQKYTPFYSQEFAARSVWAQTRNPDLFNAILEKLKSQTSSGSDYIKNLFEAKNIMFITGGPGTGKSSAVGLALKLLAESDGGKVLGVAKYPKQVEGLKTNLETKDHECILFSELESKIVSDPTTLYTFDKDADEHKSKVNNVDLTKQLELFDGVTGPKIIVVDEFTFFTEGEIQFLSKYANKHNIQIIGLGDPKQNQAFINSYSTGYEDCVMWTTPALTVSMRVSNVAQDTNNTTLDTRLSQSIDEYKKNRDRSYKELDEDLEKLGILPNTFTFVYNDDEDLYGTKIESCTNENKVDKVRNWINTLRKDGKTVALITDDSALDSLESSVDQKLDPKNAQGAEFDYVIIYKDWNTANLGGNSGNKFLTYRDLLTMTSRAKSGSIILTSDDKKPAINLSCEYSPGGKVIVHSKEDPRFKGILEKYGEYTKNLYKDYVESAEEEIPIPTPPIPEPESSKPYSVLELEEVPEENVDVDTIIAEYDKENPDPNKIRQVDLDAHKRRKAILESTSTIADMDEFSQALNNGTIDLNKRGSLLRSYKNPSNELKETYKKYVQTVSSILMYNPKGDELEIALKYASDLFIQMGGDRKASRYADLINNAIRNRENQYFYITPFNGKFLVYFITSDNECVIPVTVLNKAVPGLYKNLEFKEEIGVTGLSSSGQKHLNVDKNLGTVFRSENGAVYSPDSNIREENSRSGHEEINRNIGKPTFYVTYKPWLSPESVFRFAYNALGERVYQIQNSAHVKLIDVQNRTTLRNFIELCEIKRRVLRWTDQEYSSDADSGKDSSFKKDIESLIDNLYLSSEDIERLNNKPPKSDAEAFRDWSHDSLNILSILTPESLSHLNSVLLKYYLLDNNDADYSSKVLSEILKYVRESRGYRSPSDYHNYYRPAFTLRFYRDDVRGPHSNYDDFVFIFNAIDNTYRVELLSNGSRTVLTESIPAPESLTVFDMEFVKNCFAGIWDSVNDDVRVKLFGNPSEDNIKTWLSNNDFSINFGVLRYSYNKELSSDNDPGQDGLDESKTIFFDMRDTDIAKTFLEEADVEKVEEYLLSDSMFKNGLYTSIRGQEYYYTAPNGSNDLTVSSHKKVEWDKKFESDYVQFKAPLFSVSRDVMYEDQSEIEKFSDLDEVSNTEDSLLTDTPTIYSGKEVEQLESGELVGFMKVNQAWINEYVNENVEEFKFSNNLYIIKRINGNKLVFTKNGKESSPIEFNRTVESLQGLKITELKKEPVLFTASSGLRVLGDKNFIHIESSGRKYNAQVIGRKDNKIWVLCPSISGAPIEFDGPWTNDCPKAIVNKEYAFAYGDLYFFYIKNGFESYDTTSETVSKWAIYGNGLLSVNSNVIIPFTDIPNANIIFGNKKSGIYVSDGVKIDNKGSIVEGKISVHKTIVGWAFKTDVTDDVLVLKIDPETNRVTFADSGTVYERESDLPVKELFGLTEDNFINQAHGSEIELFKTKLRKAIKNNSYLKTLDLEPLIQDDTTITIDGINMELEEKKLQLGKQVVVTFDGIKIKIKTSDTIETLVAQHVNTSDAYCVSVEATANGDIKTCNSVDFLVSLSDNSERTGKLLQENGTWKLEYTAEYISKEGIYKMISEISDPGTQSDLINIMEELDANQESETYNILVDSGIPVSTEMRAVLDVIDDYILNKLCNI